MLRKRKCRAESGSPPEVLVDLTSDFQGSLERFCFARAPGAGEAIQVRVRDRSPLFEDAHAFFEELNHGLVRANAFLTSLRANRLLDTRRYVAQRDRFHASQYASH